MRTCQYCKEIVTTIDHLCPVRISELNKYGVSPGKPREPEPLIGIWKNVESGNIYIVFHQGKMKCPVTRVWLDSVIYSHGTDIYTREQEDFLRKFVKVQAEPPPPSTW